jgi:two-component system, response regulator, stage 0 sporulation protein F
MTPLVCDVTAREKGKGMARLPTVLIVDDDPSIRKMLVEVLSLEGYPTETAVNGREALEVLAKSGPRVVLLDLLMPEVDGRGVIANLRAHPEEREKHRIILVSAWSNLEASRDLAADGTLVKPFNVTQLLNVITAEDDVSA